MLGEIELIRRRFAPGTRVAGKWVDGEATDTPIRGSLQPATGDDILALPEGRRTFTTLKLYTRADVRVGGDGASADKIIDGDDEYEVVTTQRHRVGPIPHTKAMLQAVT